jgi:hypothetical protein
MSNENPEWPYRPPETEQEIKAAIGWLKETGQWPENGKIKNSRRATPLDRLGLPMEEFKDLLALHGQVVSAVRLVCKCERRRPVV